MSERQGLNWTQLIKSQAESGYRAAAGLIGNGGPLPHSFPIAGDGFRLSGDDDSGGQRISNLLRVHEFWKPLDTLFIELRLDQFKRCNQICHRVH